ncbi:MAG: glycosyltransferase [Gemmatimonadota bacterium]|nr:glycosyltransferase [Gemmatimonadota bacterium]
MSDQPLASIIIPVYNQAEFVSESLDSALAQSWSETEVIIVDDASTDGTSEMIARFADEENVSIYRNDRNRDCVYTFNRGISLAKGRYYGILAADDTWEPLFLEKCVTALEEHPEAGFAYTRVNLLDRQGKRRPRTADRIVHRQDRCGDEFINLVRWLNPVPHHATVVRKSCLEEVGPYNEELTTTHDWDLWLRLSRKFPVVFINEALSNYRVHEANVSRLRSRTGDKEKFILRVLDRVFGMEDLPEVLIEEQDEIYARAWLDIAEGYRLIGDFSQMRRCLARAFSLSRNPGLYLPYRSLILSLLKKPAN